MIRRLTIVLATFLWSACGGLAHAQTDSTFSTPPPPETSAPSPGAPGGSASIANPAISVIGWFQGVSGNDSTRAGGPVRAARGRARLPGGGRSVHARRLLPLGQPARASTSRRATSPGSRFPAAGRRRSGSSAPTSASSTARTRPRRRSPIARSRRRRSSARKGWRRRASRCRRSLPNPCRLYWDVTAQRRHGARSPTRARCSSPSSAQTCS